MIKQSPSIMLSSEQQVKRIEELEQALKEANKLKKRNEHYQQLFANMTHEVHVWQLVYDESGKIKTWRLLDANKLALNTWNKKLDDIIGLTADEIFGSKATETFLPIVEKIFLEQSKYEWESYFEGTQQYLQMTSIPCGDYFISTGLDITPIKKTQLVLQDTLLKLKEAISAGNIGLWDWDLTSNIVFYSPEWKRQLGYEDREIQNDYNEWHNRLHPDDIESTLQKINKTLEGHIDGHETEFRMLHKDGTYRWILSHASSLRNENGKPTRMLGSHIDITERKRMEETVLQQQKMQALGTLAGGIAHDFNNLLTPMLGYSQLIKLFLAGNEQQIKYVNLIEDSAKRAKDLVEKILIMSRKSIDNLEVVKLDKLVEEVVSLLAVSANKEVRVKHHFSLALPTIAADPSQIYQVVLNLCTNAIQAMPDGGELNITLSSIFKRLNNEHEGEPNHYVCLSVKDNGNGFDSKVKERIFEPFFTTKLQGEERGSGLGLSIVASVIKQHNAYIEVDSQPGKGTEFRVYFPVVLGRSQQSEIEAELVLNSGTSTILFIDDEQALCELGVSLLETLGYRVFAFHSGKQAIDYFKAHHNSIDLIITDYAMPEMNGPLVIEKLKQIDQNVPIIMVTGFTNMVNEEHRLKWACDAIMSKPYNIVGLSQMIAKHVKGL